jgi:PII-like signaling protein
MSTPAALEALTGDLPIVTSILETFKAIDSAINELGVAIAALDSLDDLRKLEIDTLARQVAELSKAAK